MIPLLLAAYLAIAVVAAKHRYQRTRPLTVPVCGLRDHHHDVRCYGWPERCGDDGEALRAACVAGVLWLPRLAAGAVSAARWALRMTPGRARLTDAERDTLRSRDLREVER